MRDTKVENGFTLAELLVAMLVTSIVLSAVVTLAFALGNANDMMTDTGRQQARLRYAALKISQLIRDSKLICGMTGNSLIIWRADDNNDENININELIYIERGANKDFLRFCEFPASDVSLISLDAIKSLDIGNYNVTYTSLILECENVEFHLDELSPYTRFVNISFDLKENNITHNYQINASLRSWAGHMLNETGDALVSDDD
ncbi:PilW family protein [Planctomycetota bacterium]